MFENHHPALFPKERQQKIVSQLSRNSRLKSGSNVSVKRKNIHVFSGMIFCENCGQMLTSSTGKALSGDGWRPSIYLCPSKRRHISEGCHDTTDSTVGEFTINFILNMLNAQRNFALIRTQEDLQRMLLYGKVFDNVDHLGEEGIREMFTVLSENLPENTKSGLKKKSRKPAANPEVTKLKKEQQKLERAMERLKRLYMYSEDSISEQEYITERNRISEAYEDIEMRLSEISTCERTERSITDQDFIRQATAFIISKKLSGSSYINYRRLAANTDVQILKDFFNSIIDSITINSSGQIGSIVFKNGLLHRFIYSSVDKSQE